MKRAWQVVGLLLIGVIAVVYLALDRPSATPVYITDTASAPATRPNRCSAVKVRQ